MTSDFVLMTAVPGALIVAVLTLIFSKSQSILGRCIHALIGAAFGGLVFWVVSMIALFIMWGASI